ncbi:unnamed protein product [Boreogadus saida]
MATDRSATAKDTRSDRRDDRQHHTDNHLLRPAEIQQLLAARLVPHGRGTNSTRDVVPTLHGAIDNFGDILFIVKKVQQIH